MGVNESFINATTKERRANSNMDAKTYRVVGVSTSPQGETKIRFAQDLSAESRR